MSERGRKASLLPINDAGSYLGQGLIANALIGMRGVAVLILRARIAGELSKLVTEGYELIQDFQNPNPDVFRTRYQGWYTRGLGAVREVLPERLQEFTQLYQVDKRKQMDVDKYGIHDYMLGFSWTKGGQETDVKVIVVMRFSQQVDILGSAQLRLDDILSNIHGVVQAELLDSEIDAARELLKSKHLRAAGAVAGVVLERHLARTCISRGVTSSKKDPSISDWNDKLKEVNAFDLPAWRGVQRLSDIRNLCCLPKQRDPTKDEVEELINGADKIVKTVL